MFNKYNLVVSLSVYTGKNPRPLFSGNVLAKRVNLKFVF